MLLAAAVFTRTAVLAGSLCTGAAIDRITPSCTRVQGNAECELIAGLTLSGDDIWISWPEDLVAGSVLVLAKGTARVRRGSESLSSKETMVQIFISNGKAKLHSIHFDFSQHTELCQ